MNSSTMIAGGGSHTVRSAGSAAITAVAAGERLGSLPTLLRITFSFVPAAAGLDKFFNLLTHWENYLNPALAGLLPVSPRAFMGAVGVIEIAAGILVFFRPRLGGLVVSAWLTCIALSLLAGGSYLDVAVRDLVMAVAAYTLSRLSAIVEPPGPAQ